MSRRLQRTNAPDSERDLEDLPEHTSQYPLEPSHADAAAATHTAEGPLVDAELDEEAADDYAEGDPVDRKMSRTPLLLRSSPALGTGSYGAVPAGHLSSSSEDDNETVGKKFLRHTIQGRIGKGKHALRKSSTADYGNGHDAEEREAFIQSSSGLSQRKATARRRRSSEPGTRLSGEGEEEVDDAAYSSDNELTLSVNEGLESRFQGSALPAFAPLGKSTSRTSTPKSMTDGVDSSDEEESPDDPARPPSDDSPYAQVRASVSPTDNLELSINTPRMWILSIVFAIFGSSTNLFFSLRFPSVSITPVIALLIVHPLGLLWDASLKRNDDPDEVFVNGSIQHFDTRRADGSYPSLKLAKWTRRMRLWLAQGRWNEKEHCCVFIASNVSFGFAFATDVRSSTPALPYLTLHPHPGVVLYQSYRDPHGVDHHGCEVLPDMSNCTIPTTSPTAKHHANTTMNRSSSSKPNSTTKNSLSPTKFSSPSRPKS